MFVFSVTKADIIIQTTDVITTPGTEFTIPFIIYGASEEEGTPITSAYFVMTFDTAALQYMQFLNFNPLLPQNEWFFSGNNNTGIVAGNWIDNNLLPIPLPEGSTMVEVKFKAKPGTSPLTFITLEFLDADFNIIPATGDNGSFASLQNVNFQINMRDQAISPQGVFLAGSFNNWSTTATPMTVGDSTIYSATLQMICDNAYEYRFVNGNSPSGYETVPAECGIAGSGGYNRTLTIPAGDTTLPDVCFSSCVACPPLTLTNFFLFMCDQDVGSGGVHLAGSFNGWSATATPMTQAYETVYSASLNLTAGTSYNFRFINGNSSSGYETVPVECGVLYEGSYVRSVTPTGSVFDIPGVCFASCDTCPPQVPVTFLVDMSDQILDPNGIHLAGNFNNWSPSATIMSNLGSDIFGVTLLLVPGTEAEYRFVNGNTTTDFEVVPSICGIMGDDGLYNRLLTVPEFETTLMAVCFANCSECLTLRTVTFQVDMREEIISPDGVHLAASFNGFNPASHEMTNLGNDVFYISIDLFENEEITYRFVNGDDVSDFEIVPAECGVNSGSGIYNRFIAVPEENITLPEVCFSACEDCEQQPWEKNVTFRVDMNNEEIAEEGVHLAGTFNGWDPESVEMIHLGNQIYSITLTLDEGDIHQYRFVNGSSNENFETIPGECGFEGESGGLERQLIIPSNDTVLNAVCFAECSACVVYQVTLQVDMMFQVVSIYGVHLAGSFNSWNSEDLEMASSGSSIYETTLQVYAGDTVLYRFVNGKLPADMEQVPADCGWVYNGTDFSRILIPTSDTLISEVCYSWCDPCDVGIDEEQVKTPVGSLYPNPARTTVTIPITLSEKSKVTVLIQSISGLKRSLTESELAAGQHDILSDISELPEGFYVVLINVKGISSSFQVSEKLIIRR